MALLLLYILIRKNALIRRRANLDIQYAASIGYGQKIEYYSTGGRGPLVPDLDQPDINDNSNEPYLEFLTHLLKRENKDLPQTITTSYGEDEQSVTRSYSKVRQSLGSNMHCSLPTSIHTA